MFTSQETANDEVLYHCSVCAMGYRSTAAARACEDAHLDEGIRPRPRKPRQRTVT